MIRRDLAKRIICERYNRPTPDELQKAEALLQLIDISIYDHLCKMPRGHLNLHEETCIYCKDRDCYINAPDSIYRCEGKCENFKEDLAN